MRICMATKTISIDMEAYDRLKRARLTPNESFSKVIHRAHWDEDLRCAAVLLERSAAAPVLDDETLDRLDRAQRADVPPEDPWRE